jgi:hypothetical protein
MYRGKMSDSKAKELCNVIVLLVLAFAYYEFYKLILNLKPLLQFSSFNSLFSYLLRKSKSCLHPEQIQLNIVLTVYSFRKNITLYASGNGIQNFCYR